jgi:hypothetical protein
VPEFADVMIAEQVKTAIKLVVEPQHSSDVPTQSERLVSQTVRSQVTADSDAAR